MTQKGSVDSSSAMARGHTTYSRKRYHHRQQDHGHDVTAVESLQCDERGNDDHSTVTTVASSLSSNLSSIETNLAALAEESIDPSAILESRMLVKLAEQTSYEMQQVVAWWTDSQEKDQEEALPNNMLVRPIDWWVAGPSLPVETTTTTTKATDALDFTMILSPDAKSREEALEQAHLVDMVEERTRSMADNVNELSRVMDHVERSRESTDPSVHVPTMNSNVESRKRIHLLWILFLVPWTVIMLSNRTGQLITIPPGRTITLDPRMQETCPADFDHLLIPSLGDKCLRLCEVFIRDFESETC